MSELTDEIKKRQKASYDYLDTKRLLWDEVEKLFYNQLNDYISLEKTRSRVFDPKLSTLTIERAYRVMGQLGIGKVKGVSTNDLGDAKLKNLLLEKYVIPNANSQFDFLTKLRMIDLYSNIYGSFDALVDMDVKKNGYVGPDMWLYGKRDVFPQPNVPFDDADYVIVRTWQSLSYFENLKKQDGFKNLDKIITKLKDLSGSKQNRDSGSKTKREEDQYSNTDSPKHKGFFEVLTQYEGDRWVDYCVDADLEFRDQKNPHDNGELPIVRKYSIPLLDDSDGMGDFERGKGMQMAINSNWNLYFESIRLSNKPPTLIDKDSVAAMSSIQPIAGAQWLLRTKGGPVSNAVSPINLTPQGVQTFNNTHQVANASLLNLFGTSDTSVTQQTDAGFGKTPRALQMQMQRENTRDNADRFFMEQFITKVMRKMVNLMNKRQTSSVSFRMFPDEIDQIAREYPEIKEIYDEGTGKITIKKGRSSVLYDYEIVSGSTYAVDQKQQQENLATILQLYMGSQTPQGTNLLEEQLKQQGYNLKFGELFKRIVASSGIQDWDRILEEQTEQEKGDVVLQNSSNQFQSVLQSMQQNMNQVPPQPNGQPITQPNGQQPNSNGMNGI